MPGRDQESKEARGGAGGDGEASSAGGEAGGVTRDGVDDIAKRVGYDDRVMVTITRSSPCVQILFVPDARRSRSVDGCHVTFTFTYVELL